VNRRYHRFSKGWVAWPKILSPASSEHTMSGSEFPRVVVVVTGRTISKRGRVKWRTVVWNGTDDQGIPAALVSLSAGCARRADWEAVA
jgi:hypothetical protein